MYSKDLDRKSFLFINLPSILLISYHLYKWPLKPLFRN